MRASVSSVLAILAFSVPFAVSAHSLGSSFEATTSPYFIDIGYTPDVFEAGASARFEFELRDLATRDLFDYDHVWVRISRGREALLATGVAHQDLGPTTLLYEFAEPGEFSLDVSYRSGRMGEIATSSFPVTVFPAKEQGFDRTLVAWIATLAVSAAAGFGAARARFLFR